MGSEKYCPLASIRGGVGSKCIGEQCAWWIEDCGACVFVALLRTGVEDLREQNLELAGSVVSYDAQLHELSKPATLASTPYLKIINLVANFRNGNTPA